MLWSLLACGAKDTVPEVAPEPVQTEPVVAEPMEGPGPPGGMPGRDPVYSPNGLCVGDEQVVFSCLLDDGRLASLCGTDTLQARIGTIGSVAVKMPAAPIERALFVLSEDGSRASFSNGRLSLSVFSTESGSGVEMTAPNGTVTTLPCVGQQQGDLGQLQPNP